MEVLKNVRVINISKPMDRQDLLGEMADLAVEMKWAKPGYKQAVLDRELSYATGLHTRGLDVAIPHAGAEWTLKPGMVVAVLDQPVPFEPMGGQGDTVQAQIVFLLIISDAQAHIEFLQSLASFIEDETQLRLLSRTKDIEHLITYMSGILDV